MVGMAATAMTAARRQTNARDKANEPIGTFRLRPVVAGHHQLAGFHHFCLQLCEATDLARLALFRRVLRVPDSAVHGDVWISADDLPALRLAHEQVSRC